MLCSSCKSDKPDTAFGIRWDEGVLRRRRQCKVCRRPSYKRDAQNNPKKYVRKMAIRRAWLKAGDVTAEQLRTLVQQHGEHCHYCNKPIKCNLRKMLPYGFDHVVPRHKGGKHTITNIVPCCKECNLKKEADDARKWRVL